MPQAPTVGCRTGERWWGGGCSHPWAPARVPAPSAPLPLERGGPQQDPKDEGTGMTRPRLAAAVAAAEPCQHEELLAEQPGDPAEEIGPFKRDSDK